MKYALFTLAILAAFAWAEERGHTPGGPGRRAPVGAASVRTSPGGYRSHSFWHTGFHGGK